MSPRKSSTSSAEPTLGSRPRYLGIEVAGEHLPPLSPTSWESLLTDRLRAAGVTVQRVRVIRSDGHRAIVEVDHRSARQARAAWETPASDGALQPPLRPRRTWGTLVGAKAWLRNPTTDPPGSWDRRRR